MLVLKYLWLKILKLTSKKLFVHAFKNQFENTEIYSILLELRKYADSKIDI